VVPRRASLDLDLVDEFARTRLSAYKLPAAYVVVNELPVTSTGKLARTALREIAERELTPR
jgi:acyl-CoA synthetase (AMP-forming)/AMP-acid ligase II